MFNTAAKFFKKSLKISKNQNHINQGQFLRNMI